VDLARRMSFTGGNIDMVYASSLSLSDALQEEPSGMTREQMYN